MNKQVKDLTQWEKRVKVFKYIYSIIIKKSTPSIALKEAINDFNLDVEQLKIVEYFLENQSKIHHLLNNSTNQNWTFDRLNLVDQAILIEAYSEYKVFGISKNIIIDQSVITAKKYSDNQNYKYINAILEKVLN